MPAVRKRRDELVDQRKSRVEDVTPGVLSPLGKIPRARKTWPVEIQRLYNSIFSSGQAAYLQDSDVAYAFYICDELALLRGDDARAREREAYISEWELTPPDERESDKPPRSLRRGSSARFETLMSALSSLMFTEADRRKARLELRPGNDEKAPSLVVMDEYKAGLGLA